MDINKLKDKAKPEAEAASKTLQELWASNTVFRVAVVSAVVVVLGVLLAFS